FTGSTMASTSALRAAALQPPTRLPHHAMLVPQPSNCCRVALGSILTSVAPGAAVTAFFGASSAASSDPRAASDDPLSATLASAQPAPVPPPVAALPPLPPLVPASSLRLPPVFVVMPPAPGAAPPVPDGAPGLPLEHAKPPTNAIATNECRK